MQRHARNTDFERRALNGPLRRLSSAQARQYDEHGYFLLEGVFSTDELAAVRDAIDPIEHEGEEILRRRDGGKTFIAQADAITFSIHLVKRSQVLRDFSCHPVFRDIAQDTLWPGARLYWDQAVYKKPGNPEEFPWHQDNGYTFTVPQQHLTCWVPLNDATLDNGCP